MHLRLTPSQMLDMWRLHVCYSPSVINAVFTRNDGIDTDSIHRAEINAWYRRLLLEAPKEQLVTVDLSTDLTLIASDIGATIIDMPSDVVRIVEVRLASWRKPARIVTSPTHILVERQNHPYTRATPSQPVALFFDSTLCLYPAAVEGDSLTTLSCVTFSDDEYAFDDSALASLHPNQNPS